MIESFLSGLFFYFVPITIGLLFTKNRYLFFPIGVLISYLLVILFFALKNILGFSIPPQFIHPALLTIFGLASAIAVISRFTNFRKPLKSLSINNILIPTSLFIFAFMVFFLIWKQNSPFPLQLNWDIYEHITLVNQMLLGNFSVIPSKLSDTFTFDGYTTLFHSLLLTTQIPFNNNLINTYWFLEFFHYYSILIASFILFKNIKNSFGFAFFAAILTGLIFESSIVYTNLFLIPQTFTTLLFIIIFSYVYGKKPVLFNIHRHKFSLKTIKTTELILFILSLVTMLISHFVIGSFGLGLIFLTIILQSLPVSFLKRISQLSVGLLIIVIIASLFVNIPLTGREEASYFSLSPTKKLSLFTDWYGLLFIPLFFGGLISSYKESGKFHKFESYILVILSLIALSVSIAPLSYFTKFFVIARTLINSLCFLFLYEAISVFKKSKYLFFIIFIAIFFLTFLISQLNYKNIIVYKNYASHISYQDIEAASWLTTHTKPNDLIISDPATQYVLEAISGTNSQGGAYMDDNSRKLLISLEQETNPTLYISKLRQIQDLFPENNLGNQKYFILSGRYISWQKLPDDQQRSFFYNIWSPKDLDPNLPENIDRVFNSDQFELVYQNNQIRIYKI